MSGKRTMNSNNEEIDVQIALSEEEQLWTNVVNGTKDIIKRLKNDLVINEAMLEMAEARLGQEQLNNGK